MNLYRNIKRSHIFVLLLVSLGLTLAGCSGFQASNLANLSSKGIDGPTHPDEPRDDSEPSPQPRPPVDDTRLAAIAAQMQPGSWYELPGTNLISDVFPAKEGHPAWGIVGPTSAVGAWSGGAVAKGRLYVWGGGHADYGGNEVYAYNLETFTWERLTDPSPYAHCDGGVCETADGTPTSVHSYDAIEWLPHVGKLWMGPGSAYRSGGPSNQSFFFDTETNTWSEEKAELRVQYAKSAFDPVTELLLVVAPARVYLYDAVKDVVINRTPGGWSGYGYICAAFDYKRRVLIDLTSGDRKAVYKYDFSGVDLTDPTLDLPSNSRQATYSMVDGQKVEFRPDRMSSMGIVYDPTREVFVGWTGGEAVWTLDPTTWVWTKLSNSADEAPRAVDASGRSLTRGVFGRWRYMPKYDVYIGFNDIEAGVWLYRMPE